MTGAARGNVLVMQSGGCTPVLNRSLFGVVQEASQHRDFGEIYGLAYGLEGLFSDDRTHREGRGIADALIDLRSPSRAAWNRIARTPGAALGSTRRRLRPEDVQTVLDTLARHGIRYWFIIGGNDSAQTGHDVALGSQATGYPLTVMNVPKTIDNDLVLTDHTPGYGSAARFVALATVGAGRDAEAMGPASPVTIMEVMGRDAGWLAASAAIGRREARDAPHVICVPEVPVDENAFLEHMEDAYRRFGFAVAVVSENARGADGVLGGQEEPWYVDDFGHPYYDGPGRYLAALVGRHLGVRTRYEKPGTIQRSMMACVSRTDAEEAEMVGRAAVRYALDGHTDQIVTLVRSSEGDYACSPGLAPLAEAAGRVRTMPEEYLDPSNQSVTPDFMNYLRPLIGAPLPRLGRLG